MMENKKLKYYQIVLDGIDKSGKDIIAKYIFNLDKRLYAIARGYPTMVAYAKKFKRNCIYPYPNKDIIYIYCTVDKEDWKIRCLTTNEPKINYEEDSKYFDDVFEDLNNKGYITFEINTSYITPYVAAKRIINFVHYLNGEIKNEDYII